MRLPSSLIALLLLAFALPSAHHARAADPFETGVFSWRASQPLLDVGPGRDEVDAHLALKDPTIVQHEGRWHVVATLRKKSGKVMMEQLSFTDWAAARDAKRHVVELHDAYHCAPQLFWFAPHAKWYLIYQMADESRVVKFGPSFSTTTTLDDPASWSRPQVMIPVLPEGGEKTRWIDFWVICDFAKAHLFYTSDDGHFWRRETRKADFPLGWGKPELVLKDTREELFEASHTYKLKGREQYLTLIEALGDGGRYYKAWLADRLEGPWRPLAATRERPFAAPSNVEQSPPWTRSISHGELVRSGVDETLEVDPAHLRLVFQGVSAEGYRNKYGSIPWQIGILDLADP